MTLDAFISNPQNVRRLVTLIAAILAVALAVVSGGLEYRRYGWKSFPALTWLTTRFFPPAFALVGYGALIADIAQDGKFELGEYAQTVGGVVMVFVIVAAARELTALVFQLGECLRGERPWKP